MREYLEMDLYDEGLGYVGAQLALRPANWKLLQLGLVVRDIAETLFSCILSFNPHEFLWIIIENCVSIRQYRF